MMHGIGEFVGYQKSLEGDLIVSFAIEDAVKERAKLDKLEGLEIVYDIKKYSKNRSVNANAYFWSVCDKIARVLKTDKDAVHVLQIRRYGVFDTYDVVEEAISILEKVYVYVDIKYNYHQRLYTAEGQEVIKSMVQVHAYKHSHEYLQSEFADLLNGTIEDAHDLGIETWTQEEINNLIERWDNRCE